MEVNLPMIEAGVKMPLEQAAERYIKVPSADNFTRLQEAMYAWQFWRGLSPTDRLETAENLWGQPIGLWTTILRDAAFRSANKAGVLLP